MPETAWVYARILRFVAFPLVLAAALYCLLIYPTDTAVTQVLKLKGDPKLEAAFVSLTALALPDEQCKPAPLDVRVKAICEALEAAKDLTEKGRKTSSEVSQDAGFQSHFNIVAVLVCAQAAIVLLVLLAVLNYLWPRSTSYILLRIIGFGCVVAAGAYMLGTDAWHQPLTVEPLKLLAKDSSPLILYTSVSFTLFACALAMITLAVALVAGTYVRATKDATDGVDKDIVEASADKRAGIIRGLFGLAVICFVLTVAIVAKTTRVGQLIFDETADGYKLIEAMANSVTTYWGGGLSALLVAIFLPPLVYLLPHLTRAKDARPDTGHGFLDILGDDLFKKLISIATLAAPALVPLLEKAFS